jgi:hypothetical protein
MRVCVCVCVCLYLPYIYRMFRQESAILGIASFSSIFLIETKISYVRSQNVNGEKTEGR